MFKIISCSLFIVMFASCFSVKKTGSSPQVLIFSATKGYRHKSIEEGKSAFLKIAAQKHWKADTTEDAGVFTEK